MDRKLSKAELREVEKHKYFLSIERGYDVGLEAAREDWWKHHAQAWLEERQGHMLSLQRAEINRYKWIESEKAKRDLGSDAVFDWIKQNAAAWRTWYEKEHEGREVEA